MCDVVDIGGWNMVFYRVRKIHGKYYLVKEWYDPETKKRCCKSLGPCEAIERLLEHVGGWCGGWDLNPRRPTPSGPEPDPFVLARAPPHIIWTVSYTHLTLPTN